MARTQFSCCYRGRILGQYCCQFRLAKGRMHVRTKVYFKGRKNIPVRAERDQEREKQAIARVQADLDFTKTEVTRLEEENKILMSMAGSYKLNWMAAERSLTLAEREIEEDSGYWGDSSCFSQPRIYRESPPRRIE